MCIFSLFLPPDDTTKWLINLKYDYIYFSNICIDFRGEYCVVPWNPLKIQNIEK